MPSLSVSSGSLNVVNVKLSEPKPFAPSKLSKIPSESASPAPRSIKPIVGCASFRSEIVSLSESKSIRSSIPSESLSNGFVPTSSLFIASIASAKPSESASTNAAPSIVPLPSLS